MPRLSESTPLISSNSNPISNECQTENDDNRIHAFSLSTAALAFSVLAHSFLLVSVFPYAGFFAMHLIPGLTEETAGTYAGLIGASFMAGRTLSSFEWGKAADRYGRVKVIKVSLLLSAVVSILFGLAPTFPIALTLRFVLGMCNGLVGPVKTLASEYARGDENLETRIMGIVIGMWAYGFLINPAISGYLSDPVKQYPDAKIVERFRPALEEYPFFVPNIVGCLYCIVGFILAHAFLEETLPDKKRQQLRLSPPSSSAQNGIVTDDNEDEDRVTISYLWKRKSIRQHLLAYWFFSFLTITIDEVFPLYCISKTSGLGIPEKIIGNIFSGTGLFYIIMQYFLLTGLVDKFGVYPAMNIGTFFSVPIAILIPLSLVTNVDAAEGTLSMTSLIFLSSVYAFIRAFAAVMDSVITITTNRTVPSHQLGTLNGLSMLGGSVAKALGPLFGGILFSTCVNNVPAPFGSVAVYGILAILGIWMCMYTFVLEKCNGDEESLPAKHREDEELASQDSHEKEEDWPPSF
eukprot:jgi/Psemu1/187586/e_gw1.69.40.1